MKNKNQSVIKKALCLILALGTVATSAACSEQKTYSLFDDASWLNESVNETCVYGIEYQKPEDSSDQSSSSSFSVTIDPESALTTKLTYSSYNNTPCYLFETYLSVKGSYSVGEKTIDIDDETTSKCYFLKDNIAPLYSEKTVKNTTPGSSLNFFKTYYSVICEYDKAAAKLTCTIKNLCDDAEDDEETGVRYYKLSNSKKDYENYDKSYVDNELLMLFPRTCALEESYYQTFNSLDATAEKINSLKISVSAATECSVHSDYSKDGTVLTPKMNAFTTVIGITSSFSGSNISFCYAAETKEQKRLLTMKTEYAYSLGSLYYSLKSVTTK